MLRVRSKVQHIRIRPLQVLILGLISSLLSMSSCFMGKKMSKTPAYGFQKPTSEHPQPASKPR